MDLKKSKYIIVEVIPTSISKDKGDIVQLSALKLDGIKLIDRFDYRLDEDKIPIQEFIDMCSYDKDNFTYLNTTDEILAKFREFSSDYPILILDNLYTRNFLADFNTQSIAKYLKTDYSDDMIQELISKYNLEETNYIVDILYESIIREID